MNKGQLEPDPARDTMFNLNKGGTSMSFKSNFEWVQRLGLQHWANIVVGTVTRINRYVVLCTYVFLAFTTLLVSVFE
jgi:hypothetical protein